MTLENKAEAMKAANAALQRMRKPSDWSVCVWHNWGWHFCLEFTANGGLLSVHSRSDGRFYGMLSTTHPHCGDCRWPIDFISIDPHKAVDHTLKRARKVVEKERAILDKLFRTLPKGATP